MNSYWPFSRPQDTWFSVGLASSFPDVGFDDGDLSQSRTCGADLIPGCKVFDVPATEVSQRTEIPITPNELEISEMVGDIRSQVLVFQYKGKFFAVDNKCPHSSFPLSRGIPFDIEDFGVVLSAGITCPKHGWSFDLYTGMSDRAAYRLTRWEVELRDTKAPEDSSPRETGGDRENIEREVWVRRKPRIG